MKFLLGMVFGLFMAGVAIVVIPSPCDKAIDIGGDLGNKIVDIFKKGE